MKVPRAVMYTMPCKYVNENLAWCTGKERLRQESKDHAETS